MAEPLGGNVVGSYLPSMKWGGTRSEGGRRGAFAVRDRYPAGSQVGHQGAWDTVTRVPYSTWIEVTQPLAASHLINEGMNVPSRSDRWKDSTYLASLKGGHT